MPTYRFLNTKTNEEYEDLMSMADMEKFIKKKHIELLPPTQMNIISSTGSLDSKTDSGWKDTLSKISEAHPNSHLANQYGRKSNTDVQVANMKKKHKNRILKGGGR